MIGSVNLDMVATAPRLPGPGETVTGASFAVHPGGKGANQALAARRLGADVWLLAMVGTDPNVGPALELLRRDGVDLSRAFRAPEHPTGVALIVVDEEGENQIAVAPGANAHLGPSDVDVTGFEAIICQLEVPIETVTAAARASEGLVVLNAAPVRELPDPLIEACDVIVVNEGEYIALQPSLDASETMVVVTMGARGAVARRSGQEVAQSPSPKVNVVDTVGAGDTFVSALAIAMLEDQPIADALGWACAAGALATTVAGAQPSIPDRQTLDDFLANL